MLRATSVIAVVTIGVVGAACTHRQLPGRSPALARRADSIAALDPSRELRLALARKDERFIGVCGYACLPVGLTSEQIARWPGPLNVVQGTSDAPPDDDAIRLNRVAGDYATRYNKLLAAHFDSVGPRLP